MELNCLFENARYIVCQIKGSGALHSEGIEVVSKENHCAAYLTGSMRKVFMRQMKSWREQTPNEDEVEARLDEFLVLNTNPLVLH